MPHGSRVDPTGRRQYSTCMMDDQLVEIDTRTFEVARRFSVAKGKEGPLAVDRRCARRACRTPADAQPAGRRPGGSRLSRRHAARDDVRRPARPTWAQPSADGRKIFVACNKADEILEIDRDAWAITRRLKTGRGVYNLAVTPDGKLLVATLKQGSMVEVFDLASGKSLRRSRRRRRSRTASP